MQLFTQYRPDTEAAAPVKPHDNPLIYASLGVLVFLFFFLNLGGYDLSSPDEPRYALVAREMLTDHHWVLLHRNGRPYPDKPPAFFWSIAGISYLAGGKVTPWTARMPSAVAATLILLLMWRWSRRNTEDHKLPLLTVLILMSCAKFFFQARMAQIDMLLCFFTTASMVLGYHAVCGAPYSRFWLGICLGMGILTKGPVGLAVPLGAVGLFALFRGRQSWRNFPLKALLWALIPVSVWILLLVIDISAHDQWPYLKNLLFKQTVVRYFSAWHHHEPFYFLFGTFLMDFLPWTPFLLVSIPFSKAQRRKLDDRQRFAWAVIVFTLLFFSLSKGKRGLYILPLFPFAAYLVAVRMWAWLSGHGLRPWDRMAWRVVGVALLLIGLAGVVFSVAPIRLPFNWIEAPKPDHWIGLTGLVLIALSVGILIWISRKRFPLALAGLIAAMLAGNLVLYSVMLPWLSPYRSAKRFMTEANFIIHSREQNPVVGMVGFRSAYRLYGDFPLVELSWKKRSPEKKLIPLADFWKAHPRGWVIITKKDWERFQTKHRKDVEVHLSKRVGRGRVFMLMTPESPETPSGRHIPIRSSPGSCTPDAAISDRHS
jgi:4-amino-4-deoxy-L-arabinose transferase-like glycosyltransferase